MIPHATPQKVLGHVIRIAVIKISQLSEDFFKSGYPGLSNISFTSGGNSRVHWTHCYARILCVRVNRVYRKPWSQGFGALLPDGF